MTAAAAVGATAAVLLHRDADSASYASSRRAVIPAPDPVARTVLAEVAARAQRAPVDGASSNDGVRVLSRQVGGKTWRLALAHRVSRTCWLLLVPQTTREGTCGTDAELRSRPLLVYMGAKPGAGQPARWEGYVVYGIASPRVRWLRLMLADCSSLRIPLQTRPLFWRFVPAAKLRRNVLPVRFDAAVDGRRVRGRLPQLATSLPHTARCR